MTTIRPIGPIREVDAPKPNHRQSQFDALFKEIMLRLEQTPCRKALALPYPDKRAANLMRDRLGVLFRRRMGAGVVGTSVHQTTEGADLLIWRGPEWKRRAS